MDYEKIRKVIEKLAEENYEDFIKAIIGFECGIDDKEILDGIYDKYMEDDSITLLNDDLLFGVENPAPMEVKEGRRAVYREKPEAIEQSSVF